MMGMDVDNIASSQSCSIPSYDLSINKLNIQWVPLDTGHLPPAVFSYTAAELQNNQALTGGALNVRSYNRAHVAKENIFTIKICALV